jgi:outer membrane protein
MMKQLAAIAFAAAMAFGSSMPAAAQQLRVGYLNTERVLAESVAFAGVRATMEREFAPLREEIEGMETRLQAAEEQFRAQSPTLTETARQQRQQALQQQFADYQQRTQQIQAQVTTREQELMAPVMERVRLVLEDVRREGAYSFIISPPDGMVLAVDPALDVTADVIRRLAAPPEQ